MSTSGSNETSVGLAQGIVNAIWPYVRQCAASGSACPGIRVARSSGFRTFVEASDDKGGAE